MCARPVLWRAVELVRIVVSDAAGADGQNGYGARVDIILFTVVLYGMSVFALFWVIRLAVRYGVNDALSKNRSWLGQLSGERPRPE